MTNRGASSAQHDSEQGHELGGRTRQKAHCSYEGCTYSSWDRTRTELHEELLHVQCSCGRFMTERALRAHVGYVASRRIPHRPFDADPAPIDHDPYRAACDALLDWAYQLSESQPDAKLEGSYVAGRILALVATELIDQREGRPLDRRSADRTA